MTHASSPLGVLLMAYGGPNSPNEIPGYLADIRAGRPTTPEVLEEITHNYIAIGGKSPLLALSTRQAEAVSRRLDPAHFRVLVAKGVHAPVAAYAPVCQHLIRVDTPGVTTADLSRLTYHHRRRPMFPFEPEVTWTPVHRH